MSVKEPSFDRPIGIGATGEDHVIDPSTAPIEVGTRITLVYQGKQMLAEVVEVKKRSSQFVGTVLEFEDHQRKHGDLQYGDSFRFNRHDVRWID